MIKYEWRQQLNDVERAELTDLLDRAAAYDAEPEYTTIAAAELEESLRRTDGRSHHLVIWMLPYATELGEGDRPERIAGILTLVNSAAGDAQARLVIDPDLRSIGISTLLLERIGLDCAGPEGWAGTGARTITAWAQGNHPAAGRISNRFLIPRTRRVWKLIRATGDVQSTAAAPVLEQVSAGALQDLAWASGIAGGSLLALRDSGRIHAVASLNDTPVNSEEFGTCITLSSYRAAPTAAAGVLGGLLDGVAAIAQEKGFSGLAIHVDSDDAQWVNACRINGFQHDRTDVRYQLAGHP